jgi:hypothetical protein
MSENSTKISFKGFGFTCLLTIIFVILKLTGVIGWSWLWVLSPLWISFALGILIFLFILILGALARR